MRYPRQILGHPCLMAFPMSPTKLVRATVGVALLALVDVVYADVATGEDETSGWTTLAGIAYVETLTGGAEADAELPMLIALHYMGGGPSTSVDDYGDIDVPARLLSLAGPHEFRDGYSWFSPGYYDLDSEAQRAETFSVAERVADFIREARRAYPTRGVPILTGYSQGADLTHVIALRNADLIAAGLPMGGRFPESWRSDAAAKFTLPAEIVLFHGAADQAVDVSESIAAARYYTKSGVSVTLHTYAGVGHAYPARMKADYEAAATRLLGTID